MDTSIFNKNTVDKCDKKAQKYREIGNIYFCKKDFFFALFNYNKSINYAETKTVASLGYGNRSAVYVEIFRFEDCLENIQLARENEYPEDKLSKLKNREARCRLSMRYVKEHTIDPWKIFELSYPANEKIPWIVDRVEMRWTKKFGRGIYAKEDLKAGDVICVEEPIINYTNDENPYTRCFKCSKSCGMNLIACDQTASMMFCSTECKQKIYSEAIEIDEIVSADVKMLSSIVAGYESVENFDDFIKDTNLKDLNKTIFDFDFSNPNDPEYKKNLITCLLSLSTNDRVIDNSCHIRDYVSEKAVQHILSILNLNKKNSFYLVNGNGSKELIIGHHITLFESLMNHSCYGNVISMNLDNKVITVVYKAIKKGEQIFVNYDDLSSNDDDYSIEDIHQFSCNCGIHQYIKKYGNYGPHRVPRSGFILNLIKDAMIKLMTNDHDKAKRSIKLIWDEINRDTSIPNFLTYCYPNAMTAMRMITFYLSYPFE